MTSLVDAIYHVKYNPFKYSEYVASFYSELANVDQDLLLSQLIIPLCSHREFSRKLSNANSKSSMWTTFKDRSLLYDLQERLNNFKSLTELSMQYCLVNNWLDLDVGTLTVTTSEVIEVPYERQRSAARLGKLFSNLSVIEIYTFLGVKPK